ncbi:MAG: response regulator [Planctomycetaceae bacterium]|jgi:CheY-like chemotaxis protein|nr:response regulator [Planctomycetaceae bacterium]MBT6154039.1 response regulator [Planctomycetaceae bacterium]MBT6485095.1 response regulator [Planctomycetaceae bacterium]MBT6495908.1 response regulator [Planctomycetaceae bacterium]
MSQTTILVIDDSATIRRLVDSTLSEAGYRVVLTATGEEGVECATSERPALILLDHQLPGTTGFDVCQQLLKHPDVRSIPVVISSTLRKKAYVEYTDLPNVVDMLPKPYTEELLATTVANALDTGSLIVASQLQGTAIPEVIDQVEEYDLSGLLSGFSLREIIDFLNNGNKTGSLQVESGHGRVSFYVANGRVQAAVSSGIDSTAILQTLPETLRDLAPVLNMTVGGRLGSEMDGLVELLDRKVLDPRLLRMLLRHQATMLVRFCFTQELKGFRFECGKLPPPLYRKLPLDISLAALLVDGALRCDECELPEEAADSVYVRRKIRGQNLDRAGLTPQQVKLLGMINDPISISELTPKMGWDENETRRVLHGLCLAELAESQARGLRRLVVAFEADPRAGAVLRDVLSSDDHEYSGKVVRDRLALQLLLKRSRPDGIILSLQTDDEVQFASKLYQRHSAQQHELKWIFILPQVDGEDEDSVPPALRECATVLHRPYNSEQIVATLESAFGDAQQPAGVEAVSVATTSC